MRAYTKLLAVVSLCATMSFARPMDTEPGTFALSCEEVTQVRMQNFSFTVGLLNNPGINTLKIKVDFDINCFEILSFEDFQLFGVETLFAENKNTYIVSWSDINGSTNSGKLFKCNFKFRNPCALTDQAFTFSCLECQDANSNPIVLENEIGVLHVLCDHKRTRKVLETRPTCSDVGYTQGTYCDDCGTFVSGHEEIPATGIHNFTRFSNYDEEYHTAYCNDCSHSELQPHEWNIGYITEHPTHTQTGIRLYTCKLCNAEKEEIVPVTDAHTFKNWISLDDTTHIGECECGQTSIENHTWNSGEVIKEANCKETGIIRYTCTKCGETREEIIGKTDDHKFGAWVIDYAATCVKKGRQHRTCSVCGLEEVEEFDGSFHEHTSWRTIKNPTCTENGEEEEFCIDCGEIISHREIQATGHKPGIWTVVTPATCEHDGVEKIYCMNCGIELDSRVVTKLNHEYSDWIIDEEANCIKEGSKHRICSDCGDKQIEIIPMTDHLRTEWFIVKNATCSQEGLLQLKCLDCGEILEEKTIDKLAHQYVHGKCEYCGNTNLSVNSLSSNYGNAVLLTEGDLYDAVLTDEEKAQVDGGAVCAIQFVCEKVESSKISSYEKSYKEQLASNEDLAGYFSIKVIVRIGDTMKFVDQLNEEITVELTLPKDIYDENKLYGLVALNGSKISRTSSSISGNKVLLKTDKLTNFGVTYYDMTKISGPNIAAIITGAICAVVGAIIPIIIFIIIKYVKRHNELGWWK